MNEWMNEWMNESINQSINKQNNSCQGMPGNDAPPNLPKDLLLATKWGFCRRGKGWGSKRSTFLGLRTPQIDPGYGPGKSFLFWQSGGGGHLNVMVYSWTSLVKLITKHVLSFHAKKQNKTKQNKKQNKKKPNTTPVNEGVFIPNFTPK